MRSELKFIGAMNSQHMHVEFIHTMQSHVSLLEKQVVWLDHSPLDAYIQVLSDRLLAVAQAETSSNSAGILREFKADTNNNNNNNNNELNARFVFK